MAEKKTPDSWFAEERPHQDGLLKLRELALAAGLSETLKWGQPCYTHDGRNIAGIGAFKAYFGLWFFEGARLDDTEGLLVNAQPGRTQSMRQWRFTSAGEIKSAKVKKYLAESKAMPPVSKPKINASKSPLEIPSELAATLKENKAFQAAFEALTPACQREYATHISEAKRIDTKARRLDKIIPMIMAGGGLHDKYR